MTWYTALFIVDSAAILLTCLVILYRFDKFTIMLYKRRCKKEFNRIHVKNEEESKRVEPLF